MACANEQEVVICGGGIIGVATAYYLTLQGLRPVLIERNGVACAASGTRSIAAHAVTQPVAVATAHTALYS